MQTKAHMFISAYGAILEGDEMNVMENKGEIPPRDCWLWCIGCTLNSLHLWNLSPFARLVLQMPRRCVPSPHQRGAFEHTPARSHRSGHKQCAQSEMRVTFFSGHEYDYKRMSVRDLRTGWEKRLEDKLVFLIARAHLVLVYIHKIGWIWIFVLYSLY